MKKKSLILLSTILPNFISSANAMDIKFDFIMGTAFLATICQVDMENHYLGTKNCSRLLGVGSSHIVQNKSVGETFCVSILRWPIVVPVVDEYYFKIEKNENATLELWGSAFNPKFSYPDSIAMYGSKVINGPRDYCANAPVLD